MKLELFCQLLGSCRRGFCDDLNLNFFELKMCKYSYAATRESTAICFCVPCLDRLSEVRGVRVKTHTNLKVTQLEIPARQGREQPGAWQEISWRIKVGLLFHSVATILKVWSCGGQRMVVEGLLSLAVCCKSPKTQPKDKSLGGDTDLFCTGCEVGYSHKSSAQSVHWLLL